MRRALVALLIAFPLAAGAAESTVELKVEGWDCFGCVDKALEAVRKVEGVKSAAGDADTGKLTATVDDAKVDRMKLIAAVASVGFKAH